MRSSFQHPSFVVATDPAIPFWQGRIGENAPDFAWAELICSKEVSAGGSSTRKAWQAIEVIPQEGGDWYPKVGGRKWFPSNQPIFQPIADEQDPNRRACAGDMVLIHPWNARPTLFHPPTVEDWGVEWLVVELFRSPFRNCSTSCSGSGASGSASGSGGSAPPLSGLENELFWIRLGASSGAAYNWVEVIESPDIPGNWVDKLGGRSGTFYDLPAFEAQKTQGLGEGLVVLARIADDGDSVRFAYEAQKGGAGSGGGFFDVSAALENHPFEEVIFNLYSHHSLSTLIAANLSGKLHNYMYFGRTPGGSNLLFTHMMEVDFTTPELLDGCGRTPGGNAILYADNRAIMVDRGTKEEVFSICWCYRSEANNVGQNAYLMRHTFADVLSG